jgi:hypothetical protein
MSKTAHRIDPLESPDALLVKWEKEKKKSQTVERTEDKKRYEDLSASIRGNHQSSRI